MSQRSSDALEQAIDELKIPVDRDALVHACSLRDRLDAKILEAVGDYDHAELWRDDGATSMVAWLRAHAEQSARDASWQAKTARRLRQLPHTAAACIDGSLSIGQLKAIVGNISDRTVGLFAQQEDQIIAGLTRCTVAGVANAMQHWKALAEAALDDNEPADDEQTLNLSKTMDGRRELSGSLNPETGAALETALRLADRYDPDSESDNEPKRTPARRRADALDTIARHFLDHQLVNLGKRHRPHLNVFVNLDDIVDPDNDTSGLDDIDNARAKRADKANGWLADGTVLDAATIRTLLCDAGVHRVVTRGHSSIVDYGHSTRTIHPSTFAVLVARDRCCRFPGCDRPPSWCEGHHLVPWEHNGPTDTANLALFCSRHHHLLHTVGWNATMRHDGVIEITRPKGEPILSHPYGSLRYHERSPAA